MLVFLFGSVEDICQLHLDEAMAESGVPVPDIHWDEMTLEEMKIRLIHIRMAVTQATEVSQLPFKYIEPMLDWYVEIYEQVITHDPKVRAVLARGGHKFLSQKEEHIEKFRVMYREITGRKLPF